MRKSTEYGRRDREPDKLLRGWRRAGRSKVGLLLARRGVQVALLEGHRDFDRELRGDVVHPSVMEILDQIGLAERLHELPHTKLYGPTIMTAEGPFTPVDLRRLKTKFP